ncbi:hypothetical protein LMH87_001674 [Akanthomyces muscarius]|uniref:FAD-binding domain-containing protein n=1 Tax=Akanthomyces muscarius TaxID=2231603 RepID=A0A9W8UIF9_AKAMU|nr:hypothetical protein LMH87_001674 [Akanthomyces muscarius]KAJ4147127.1 hypothetical protein LMH87_001674 [Akanthomyces muscarius]
MATCYTICPPPCRKRLQVANLECLRSDLLGILLARATELGAVCRFGASVADIDAEADRSLLTMENEQTFLFDLVIASDGIRSKTRTKTVGSVNVIHPVTVYSINVDREKLKQHKDLEIFLNRSGFWNFLDIPELGTWTSKNGRVVLIGDAAHAMRPFAARGAGSSIEDSACLAKCISRASSIPEGTAVFEPIRSLCQWLGHLCALYLSKLNKEA